MDENGWKVSASSDLGPIFVGNFQNWQPREKNFFMNMEHSSVEIL